jgi:CRP-like cAMP-binding protein
VVKEADLFLIPQQDFLTMLYTNKEIARKFISMLSSNLYKTENQLIELAYQSVRHRVASTLVTLNKSKDNTPYIITVSRKDLSNMVGTSTESLNRTLADFKEEGVIEISDKGLCVLDLPSLELVSN